MTKITLNTVEVQKMKDTEKTKEQLINELRKMHQRITELEKLEEKHKQMEEERKRLINAISASIDGIAITDEKDRYVYVNEAHTMIYGYSPEELLGKTWRDLVPPEIVKPSEKVIEDTLHNKKVGMFNEEVPALRKDGRLISTEIKAKALWDNEGNYAGHICVVRDISERKYAEERYRILFEESKDAIYMSTVEGKFLDMNPAGVELFGYSSKEELLKIDIAQELYFNPADREKFQQIVKKQGYVKDFELALKRKDGKKVIVLSTTTPVCDDKGNIIGYRGIMHDVTEHKRAEEKILRRNREVSALYTIDRAVSQSLNLDEILNDALDTTLNVLEIESGGIYLFEPDGETLYLRVYRGVSEELVRTFQRLKPGEGISGRAVAEGKPVVLNVQDYPTEQLAPFIIREGFQTLASAPLLSGGKVLGALTLITHKERAFPTEELELLAAIGAQIGIAVQNALLYEEVRRELTHRMHAEKEIQRTKTYLESILNNSLDLIFTIKKDGTFGYINPQLEKITGYRQEDVLGKIFMEFIPEHRKNFMLEKWKEINAGISGTYETEIIKRDGTLMHCLVSHSIVEGFDEFLVVMRDITERKRAEETLQQSFENLQKILEGTILAMAKIVETRDPYTAGHQQRVAKLSSAIAKEMGLPEERINTLRMAAFIHDVGKIYIPAEILSKPGELNEIEFKLVKTHPQVGHDILKTIELLSPVVEIVLQHHERMDGSGYPQGLSGESIILEAKILGVSDVVEAMSSHRPYRSAIGIGKALEEISKNKGILYDPQVVDVCFKLFYEKEFKFD